jgi:uncharacterized protein (TIGR03083 family)
MSLLPPSRDELTAVVADSVARWAKLVRTVDDPSKTVLGHWSIAELAAHVGHVFQSMPELLRGEPSPIKHHRAIGTEWDEVVRQDPERNIETLVHRVEDGAAEALELATEDVWQELRPWHGGLEIPAYALASVMLSEAEIHGRDIAKAVGAPWEIPQRHGGLMVDGYVTFLPEFVNEEVARGFNATYDLAFRSGPRVLLSFQDGDLTISGAPPESVDCHLSVDPVTYLLIGYNRTSQLRAIATGKVLAWGRKPWLGFKLGKVFVSV